MRRGRTGRLGQLWGWLTASGLDDAVVAIGGFAVLVATLAWIAVDATWHRERITSARAAIAGFASVAAAHDLDGRALLYRVAGHDGDGRGAVFHFIVHHRDAALWVRGRADQVARAGRIVPAETFGASLYTGAVADLLGAAKLLIGVGLASSEDEAAGASPISAPRSQRRAKQTADWLRAATSGSVPVWSLDLGSYQGFCSGCDTVSTDWQRPILTIGLTASDAGVRLGEALADALKGRLNLPDPDRATRFSLVRER